MASLDRGKFTLLTFVHTLFQEKEKAWHSQGSCPEFILLCISSVESGVCHRYEKIATLSLEQLEIQEFHNLSCQCNGTMWHVVMKG